MRITGLKCRDNGKPVGRRLCFSIRCTEDGITGESGLINESRLLHDDYAPGADGFKVG